MSERILFIHAGGEKTGSSMLQNFLESYVTQLENYGFAYENRINIKSKYEITSGNGSQLYEALQSTIITGDEIDNLVTSYFGQYDKAICSCEVLSNLCATKWRRLLESSKRLEVKCRVIFYVRNPITYHLSAYDQVIKRHGEWRPFEEWVVGFPWGHFRELKIISEVFPKEDIYVRHFDSASVNLIRDFLDNIGVDTSFKVDENDKSRIVNRSLTKKERQVMCAVNRIHGEKYSTELSDLLIYSNPYAKAEPVACKRETIDYLQENLSNEVGWINKTFFNGLSIVSILPTEPVTQVQRNKLKINPVHNKNVEKLSLDWAIKKMETIKNESEQNILNALQKAYQNSSLPADFDPFAYLLINRDVLSARIDPIEHYVNFGKQEGRVYKFT